MDNLRKKAQDSLRKELAKNSADKYSAKIYAKQVAQNDKQKSRILNQKAKIQNMQYGLDTYFCISSFAFIKPISKWQA